MKPRSMNFSKPMDQYIPFFEDKTRINMDFSDYIFFGTPHNTNEHETPQEIAHLNGYERNPLIKQKITKRQLGFNIFLLAFLSIAAGWFGILLKLLTGQTNLALSVFLAIPPLGVLILNLMYKNSDINPGIRLNIIKYFGVYTLSILLIPGLVVILLAVGKLGGLLSFGGLANQGFGSLLSAVVLLFFSDFIKNCLEEFTWRGFFTQHFKVLGAPDLLNHLLTGIIWVLWHLPYWLFFLDRTSIAAFPALNNLPSFILMSSCFLLALSLVLGEIRLLTNSTWPAILLHCSANSVTVVLLLKKFVTIKPSSEIWLSPDGNSIIFIILLIIVGIVLNRIRSLQPKRIN
jgi:hypothetical protein